MLSRDGGETWQKLDGMPLELPVVADQHGPTDRITLEDEYEVHTWLSNFLVKDGKLHFVYLAQSQPSREHYVRYDLKTAQRDLDLWPDFKGEQISLRGLDGFFASRASQPDAPLYCVLADQGRLACLASDDNGATWYDYAVSEKTFTLYAIGGCREITADGYIIGSFTDTSPGSDPRVYFFKIRAGLSRGQEASSPTK
jgi:Neuraminidase (sialidase)